MLGTGPFSASCSFSPVQELRNLKHPVEDTNAKVHDHMIYSELETGECPHISWKVVKQYEEWFYEKYNELIV